MEAMVLLVLFTCDGVFVLVRDLFVGRIWLFAWSGGVWVF